MSDTPILIRVIRARAGGRSVNEIAKATGVPYSRAHAILRDGGDHKLGNIEKALTALAPELMAFARNLAAMSPPGGQPAGTTEDPMAKAKKTAAKAAPKKAAPKAKPAAKK
ncbi:MAG: hypothetical protein RLZZ127_1527 [Planctomycetota bacterium]|jgi:hypothetical protein